MDKIENLISITEVPAGPYIVKGEFKIITKDGKENILTGRWIEESHILYTETQCAFIPDIYFEETHIE